MNIKILLFIFFIGISKISIAQVLLKSEKINSNTYTLEFKNNHSYKIIKQNGKKILTFPFHEDPSKSGQFILPEKNLFIPIPPNSNPSAKLVILKQEKINAIPEINPKAILRNDSTIVYAESKLTELKQEPKIENKGYLWIGNNYYINLKIQLFEYSSGLVVANKDFQIILKFKNDLIVSENKKGISQNKFTINSKFKFKSSLSIRKYPPNNKDNWIDYSKIYLKIGVGQDAIYRIRKSDLTNKGIDPNSIDPRTFKLYLKGTELPIYVLGENNGVFDNNDFIEFVGIKNYGDKDYREPANYNEPYNEFMSIYSDTTSYFLTWDGEFGKRIDTLLNYSSSPLDTLDYYDEFLHFEQNQWYDFSLSGGEVRRQNPNIYENETWEWWVQGVGTRNFSFNVTNLRTGFPAKAYLKIQSWASNISTDAHNLAIKINSNPAPVDSTFINKYQVVTLQGEFNSNNLINGNNKLKLVSYATESNPNSCFGDWWEIEYPRQITTGNDSLLFGYRNLNQPKFAVVKVSGLASSDYSLYKLIDNKPVTKVTNYFLSNGMLAFNDSVKNGTTYILTKNEKILSPKFYYKKNFVNFREQTNSAEYLLITNPDFIQTANDYTDFIHNNYNVSTKVVDVFDIYDEFNYGYLSPESIKDFLMMTQDNWQPPYSKYVFLIGKPTYDFHGYKTKYQGAPPQINYVPSYGEPVSDVWYVIWDSTDSAIPQINVGRLPIQSNAEFQMYLQKHQNYLSQKYDSWNKRFLFLSGGNFNDPIQLNQLKGVNDFIIDNYVIPPPIGGIEHHFYKTADPVTNFGPFTQAEIQNAIDEGGLFISYLGHSGTQTWDNSISQSDQLENAINRNPMITDFGCSTGKYAEPDVTSFSEQFTVKENGQALTYVGNSSLGFLSTATTFPQIFFKKFLKDSVLNIGDAHRLAKMELLSNYGTSSVNNLFSMTNELIGDPIISLKLPPKPNLVIDNSLVEFNPALPSDADDSVTVKIRYFNYGMVTGDSIKISVEDIFEGNKITELILSKPMPDFNDSIQIKIPTKNNAGLHQLKIKIDPNNFIDEIYENDNNIVVNYNVLSASIKFLANYNVENELNDTLTLINPTKKVLDNNFIFEVGTSADFNNPSTETLHFDSLITNYPVPSEYNDKRIWVRAKMSSSDEYGFTKSFFVGDKNGYLLNDSISFIITHLKNILYKNNSLFLNFNNTKFEIISAGFNDGRTSFIFKNGQNFIPENTLRGHHICLFNDSTYNFIKYKHFDLLGGGSAEAVSYIQFLDTLSSKYLVLFAVTDEGKISLTNDLKSKIKEFGSKYIDSLEFRGSWAFIGKRGAFPGSMPEAYSRPFEGRVTIDTTLVGLYKSGSLLTTQIGPASIWQKLTVSDSLPSNSEINYQILGIKNESEIDTLNYATMNNGEVDLFFLNSLDYNYIKVLAEFNASSDLVSPVLKSLGVSYTRVPELATNYQVVSVEKDTLQQGEVANLSFYVYNVGESTADSFKVLVDVIKPDNSKEQIYSTIVDSLGSENRRKFNVSYNTSNFNGARTFAISIDSEDRIQELYEDNNFYNIPFYVIGDTTRPSMNLTFDGNELFDGEYISSTPQIKVELIDPSLIPITDTSTVSLYLNNKYVNYNGNESNISVNYSESNPKVTVNYTPTLEDGEYTLRVFGKDASGNISDSSGISKSFNVESDAKLLSVYNYPNPFSNDTYFTFKLTQIPNEIKIRVFTVAGRLIKEIKLNSSQLNFDLNKIYWDGRDADGDLIGNGVYLYKVIMDVDGKKQDVTQKLAVVR